MAACQKFTLVLALPFLVSSCSLNLPPLLNTTSICCFKSSLLGLVRTNILLPTLNYLWASHISETPRRHSALRSTTKYTKMGLAQHSIFKQRQANEAHETLIGPRKDVSISALFVLVTLKILIDFGRPFHSSSSK